MEHERQRAIHRKIFEDQMRALEQQQQQELLSLPVDQSGGNSFSQHLAVSAPTTPPRVNAILNDEISPALRTKFAHIDVDVDILSKAVGSSVSDKRKSVTYAPMTRSPDVSLSMAPGGGLSSGYGRAGAKSMPASRRTSASSHDEELAGHLHGLSLIGESHSPTLGQDHLYVHRGNGRHDDD